MLNSITVSGVITQLTVFKILKYLGVEPHCTLGFSYGEFANRYARGDLTIDQAIFLAYCVEMCLNSESTVWVLMKNIIVQF